MTIFINLLDHTNVLRIRTTAYENINNTVVNNHNLLVNLDDDDHPQYHNDTRGDARYYTKAEFGTLALVNTVNNSNWSGTVLAVVNGGTGGGSASEARTNFGLGTIATQDASTIAVTGGAIDGTPIGGTTSAAGTFTGIDLEKFSVTDASAATFTFTKSAIGTLDTHALVAADELLGEVVFSGSDGVGYIRSALIKTEIDGTPGVDDMPGRIILSTSADGATTPTERVRISSTGLTTVTGTFKVSTGAAVGGATAGTGGLAFPATAVAVADPNTLDDYEEYTAASTACTGAIVTACIWKLTKIGNQVTLTLPAVQGNGVATTNFTVGLTIPAKFRPAADFVSINAPLINNAVNLAAPGAIRVTSAGVISVWLDGTFAGNFTVTANAGLAYTTSVSWTI